MVRSPGITDRKPWRACSTTAWRKLTQQFDDGFGDRAVHEHGYRMLVFAGFFEGVELAAEQRWGHVAVHPIEHPPLDHSLVSLQVDERDAAPGADRDVAVGPLQVGTGDDARLMRRQALVDPARDRLQPGQTVLIVERLTGAHLLDICRRVQVVAFLKRPTQHPLQLLCDGRFAAAETPISTRIVGEVRLAAAISWATGSGKGG